MYPFLRFLKLSLLPLSYKSLFFSLTLFHLSSSAHYLSFLIPSPLVPYSTSITSPLVSHIGSGRGNCEGHAFSITSVKVHAEGDGNKAMGRRKGDKEEKRDLSLRQ